MRARFVSNGYSGAPYCQVVGDQPADSGNAGFLVPAVPVHACPDPLP
jgi:hypothetical protein